jgi:uncharacterized membrane protein YcaP (DUF421 family)
LRAALLSVLATLKGARCQLSHSICLPPWALARKPQHYGTAAFFPTLGGGFVLVMLHRALAYCSRRSHGFGWLIKGRSDVLIRDGVLDEALASLNRLSVHDILEDLRLHSNVQDIGDVSIAVFERNGHISVVPRKR